MEKRFSVKDVYLFGALAALFVLILLAMYMIDRQWLKMAEMERGIAAQGQDVRALRLLLERELPVAVEQTPQQSGPGDSFTRAYQATQRPDYAQGDWLVRAVGVNLNTLTPLIAHSVYAKNVQSNVLESLLKRDPQTLQWQGHIAKDWSTSEDGLSIHFTLRDNVRFSDGHPLDASDVVFSYDFLMHEAIAAPDERAVFEQVKSVSAIGPYELVFHFKRPYYNSLALVGETLKILPRHFYAPYLKDPQAFNDSKALLLGSGPYQLKDAHAWTPDQQLIELVRNPRYWGRVQPPFERLLWKVITNHSARLSTFHNRQIDIYEARPQDYHALLQEPALLARTRQFEFTLPTGDYDYIAWNQIKDGKPSLFADKRVRQAMTYLTDRQAIIDQVYLGYAQVALGPFSPDGLQHDPQLTPRAYDPQKAQALLAQAGFADRDGDGVLEDINGRAFEFKLAFFQNNENSKRMVLMLRDLYAKAGIVLIPQAVEWSVMLEMMRRRDFDAITLAWLNDVETDPYQIFHSSQIAHGGDNFVSYTNTALDAMIEKARTSMKPDERQPLWQACERQLYEDQPYTFLMHKKSLVFIDNRIHNLQLTRLGLNLGRRHLPLEVYVPFALQLYRH